MAPLPLRIALYGDNGHQIQNAVFDEQRARIVAVSGVRDERLPPHLRDPDTVERCETLEQLVERPDIDVVSLCSPRRCDQAGDAIACLEAGKHVYAEKPAALNEADLDRILAAADRHGRKFREMAGTAFEQPYLEARRLVAEDAVGDVVQVLAQKSYPLGNRRPQDEAVDGGLLTQVGVHALRMIEHVAGLRVESVNAIETQRGNPADGGLRIACSMHMHAEGDRLATAICNYLNPRTFPRHGNEMLRIFGTRGFLEITDGGQHSRLLTADADAGSLRPRDTARPYHELFFDELLGIADMPLSREAELHPTRVVLRAKASLGGI
jgi:predicted dehydrogenase